MKTQIYEAFDEKYNQNTIITENEYGWNIYANGQFWPIDECWAKFYIIIRQINN